jgi:hypothetical protein
MLNFRKHQYQCADNVQTTKGSKLGYTAWIKDLAISVRPTSYDKKPTFSLETHKQIAPAYWKDGKRYEAIWEDNYYGIFKTSKEAIEKANKLFQEVQ